MTSELLTAPQLVPRRIREWADRIILAAIACMEDVLDVEGDGDE